MKKAIGVTLLILVSAIGCGPKQTPPSEVSPTVYPYDLSVSAGNHKLELSWKLHGDTLISGYNIYISRSSLEAEYPNGKYPSTVKPYNLTIFPGDTNPEDDIEHYDAEGLENGVKYYVTVRTVLPGRSLSKPSNEVAVVAGPRGEITLDSRYQGNHDGYSFEEDDYTGADADNNDVYFYSLEGTDYLASPTRLNGFLRESKFMVLPFRGDMADMFSKVNGSSLNPSEIRAEVSAGSWVLMRTADGANVLLKVLGFNGEGKDRKVELRFAVSGLKGEIFF